MRVNISFRGGVLESDEVSISDQLHLGLRVILHLLVPLLEDKVVVLVFMRVGGHWSPAAAWHHHPQGRGGSGSGGSHHRYWGHFLILDWNDLT